MDWRQNAVERTERTKRYLASSPSSHQGAHAAADTVVAQEPNRSQRLPVPPEVIGLVLSSIRPLGLSDVDAYEDTLHRLRSLAKTRSASRLVSRTFQRETDRSAELWQPLFVGHATTPQRLAFFVKRLEFSSIDLWIVLPTTSIWSPASGVQVIPSHFRWIMALLQATSKPVLKGAESTTTTNVFEQTIHIAENNSQKVGYSVAFSGPHATPILEMIANYSTGTAIEVFGQFSCNIPPCKFDFSLDGAPPRTVSHVETFRSIFRLGADEIGNASTMHTVEISNTTNDFVMDYALVDAPLDTPLPGQTAGQLWVNINNTVITYHGGWNKFYNAERDCESMQSTTVGDSVGLDFIRDSIVVLGQVDASFPGSVAVNVTVDDFVPSTRSFVNSSSNNFFIYYSDYSLSPAQHHIQITVVTITQVQFFDFFGFMYHSTQSTLGEAIAPTVSAVSVSVPSETVASSSPVPSNAVAGRSKPARAGTIAGSVVGAVIAVVIAALLLLIWARRRRRRNSPVVVPFETVDGHRAKYGTKRHQPRVRDQPLEKRDTSCVPFHFCDRRRYTESRGRGPTSGIFFFKVTQGGSIRPEKHSVCDFLLGKNSAPTGTLCVTFPSRIPLAPSTPQISDEENNTAGILRNLIARVDALTVDHGPPGYTA
ncbi:hypothetical protein DFH09DRAFT_1086155 [Mycena vulgaris]|nr:hypothetical protein DFH09DRAFT_1086155 [Mycena vulgaris]